MLKQLNELPGQPTLCRGGWKRTVGVVLNVISKFDSLTGCEIGNVVVILCNERGCALCHELREVVAVVLDTARVLALRKPAS